MSQPCPGMSGHPFPTDGEMSCLCLFLTQKVKQHRGATLPPSKRLCVARASQSLQQGETPEAVMEVLSHTRRCRSVKQRSASRLLMDHTYGREDCNVWPLAPSVQYSRLMRNRRCVRHIQMAPAHGLIDAKLLNCSLTQVALAAE